MLQLSGSFVNRPVLSLRTGGQVATTIGTIINPNNLKVEGFYCQDEFEHKKTAILLSQDIRDVILQGIVVDDHDSLSEQDELVRLKDIVNIRFELLGKQVITTTKQRLGKVVDYAVDLDSMFIQKLYVAPSMFKNLAGGNLGVDRTQIVEIGDKKVIIHDIMPGVPARAGVPA
jgi:uncharacterized protein YrrD